MLFGVHQEKLCELVLLLYVRCAEHICQLIIDSPVVYLEIETAILKANETRLTILHLSPSFERETINNDAYTSMHKYRQEIEKKIKCGVSQTHVADAKGRHGRKKDKSNFKRINYLVTGPVSTVHCQEYFPWKLKSLYTVIS